jgi:hypothetical protein
MMQRLAMLLVIGFGTTLWADEPTLFVAEVSAAIELPNGGSSTIGNTVSGKIGQELKMPLGGTNTRVFHLTLAERPGIVPKQYVGEMRVHDGQQTIVAAKVTTLLNQRARALGESRDGTKLWVELTVTEK